MSNQSEEEIQEKLYFALNNKGHTFIVPNIRSIVWSEADLLSVTGSFYLHEYEIKVTESDLQKELEAFNGEYASQAKFSKHAKMKAVREGEALGDFKILPAKYSIAAPKGLIYPNDLPDFWGLYEIKEYDEDWQNEYEGRFKGIVKKTKAPEFIYQNKVDQETLWKLGRNLTQRYWDNGR